MPRDFGTFVICKECSTLTVADTFCQNCGAEEPRTKTGPLSLTIPLVVIYCDLCDHAMDIDKVTCPKCGEPLESPLHVDTSEITRRVGYFQRHERYMAKLSSIPCELPKGQMPISIGQFALFITEEKLVTEELLRRYEDACALIDVSDTQQMKSKQTRQGIKQLLQHGEHLRQLFDHLGSYDVQGENRELRDHLLMLIAELLELGHCLTLALVADTVIAFSTVQKKLQNHIDSAADIVRHIGRLFSTLDPSVVDNSLQDRLTKLLDDAERYEINSQPDFAAVMIHAHSIEEALPRFLDSASRYLRPVLGDAYTSLNDDLRMDALLLATEICAQPRPGSLAYRARCIFSLFEQAWERDQYRLMEAFNQDLDEYDSALSTFVGQIQVHRNLEERSSEMPLDSFRTEKVKCYLHVSEYVLRRFTNPMFVALDIIRGNSRTYQTVRKLTLTDRLDELNKVENIAVRAALIGAEAHLRNAAAHGDVRTNSPAIEFTSTYQFSKLSDKEFEDILANLFSTCLSLRIARESFTLVHSPDVQRLIESSHEQLSFEFLRTWVGLFGLKRARVQRRNSDVYVMCEHDNEQRSSWSAQRLITMGGVLGSTMPTTYYDGLTVQIVDSLGSPKATVRVPLTLCKLARTIGPLLRPAAIALLAEAAEIELTLDQGKDETPRFELVLYSVLDEVLAHGRESGSPKCRNIELLGDLIGDLDQLLGEADADAFQASVHAVRTIRMGLQQIHRSGSAMQSNRPLDNVRVKRGLYRLHRQAKHIAQALNAD